MLNAVIIKIYFKCTRMTMNNISTRDGLYLRNLTSDFTLLLNLPLLHAFGI